MKTLLPAIIIACAALLPVSSVQAAPASQLSSFAAKTWGGYKAGYKFNLKVTNVTIVSISGKSTKEIPAFKKGQKIPFKIGKKGELTGPKKVNVPFFGTSATINEYNNRNKVSRKLTATARITKDPKGKPASGVLNYNIVAGSPIPSPYQVSYTLGK